MIKNVRRNKLLSLENSTKIATKLGRTSKKKNSRLINLIYKDKETTVRPSDKGISKSCRSSRGRRSKSKSI